MGMIKEMKANLDASWNTRGDKFCVGSSSGFVYIGTYSEANNFWVAHPISKKAIHKASVVSVKFDGLSSRVVASASLDGTCQITSCYLKEVDTAETITPFGNMGSGPFGSVESFGETLLKVDCNGWINYCAFSPDCNTLAFCTQDCELNLTNVSDVGSSGGKSKAKPDKVNLRSNPLLGLMFIDENNLIGTGYDKIPYLFKKSGDNWKCEKTLDDGVKNKRKAKITGNSFLDKRVYFNSDIKLSTSVEMKETDTKHANYINCLKPFASDKGKPIILSTSDINGYLHWWDVQKL